MTANEQQLLDQLITRLHASANIADRLELLLPNGAEVGSLLGVIATDLELKKRECV